MRRLFAFLSWALLAASTCRSEQVSSPWADHPIQIDGIKQPGEWDSASSTPLRQGTLRIQNDARNLYLLLALTGDTTDDPPMSSAPWGDFVSLSFDVDNDRRITPRVDASYGLRPGTHQIGLQQYVGPCAFTALGDTGAKLATRFFRHRQWELSIPLTEIRGNPGGLLGFGFQVFSVNPAFNEFYPPKHDRDFSALWQIRLASGAGPASVQRRILPGGMVEIRYSDGLIKQFPQDGGSAVLRPDGTRSAVSGIETLPPTLPELPTEPGALRWLNRENENLLSILRSLLSADDVDSYLAFEGDLSPYERLARRTDFIRKLLAK